jgi:predicted aspartyl protease
MLHRRTFVAGLCALPIQAYAAEKTPKNPETLRSNRADTNPKIPAPDSEALDGKVDARDRLTLPVWLNGQGPYQFAVDTAAERSVIASEIADRLGLLPAQEARLHGIAGAEITRTVRLAELSLGKLRSTDLQTPVLPRARLEIDGLIGLDVLQDRSVKLDFTEHTLTVQRARWEHMSGIRRPGEATVSGMSRLGQLTFVDAKVEDTRVYAFIDSGADASVGNEALATALGALPRAGETLIPLQGVTGQTAMSRLGFARRFQLGPAIFRNMQVLFSDLHVFDLWDLRDRPAMLVGCDLLKLFASVELDFGRHELRLQRADIDLRMASAMSHTG